MTFGGSFINLLYDSRYQPAGWMLEMLAATLIAIPFRLTTQSFLALGMPKLQSKVLIVRLVALFSATPIGFSFFGPEGALVGIVFSQFSAIPMIALYNIRHKLFDLRSELYLLAFVPLGLGAGKMAVAALTYWK